MPLDEEIPQTASETIGANKLILSVFFHPNHFEIVDILPQRTLFTAAYFVWHVVVPLVDCRDH
jgi:hypothetical protein